MPMNKIHAITAMVVLVVFVISACGMPGASRGVSEPSQEPTVPLETLVAEAIAATAAAQTALVVTITPVLAPTQADLATNTPVPTSSPSLTPTPTFTLAPDVPMVSVSAASNCRTGPATTYDLLAVLRVGQTAEVVARSNDTYRWIIKLPSDPTRSCWLWAQNATVVGDTSRLPVITPLPSPTPKASPTPLASFSVVYASTILCAGLHEIKFKITNTGNITWESNSVYVKDQVSNEEHTMNYDEFPDVKDGCKLASNDQNLEAGEAGMTTSDGFSESPIGHSFKATIRVCSQNSLVGTCLDKTILFTP
jgi:hypothetical protein